MFSSSDAGLRSGVSFEPDRLHRHRSAEAGSEPRSSSQVTFALTAAEILSSINLLLHELFMTETLNIKTRRVETGTQLNQIIHYSAGNRSNTAPLHIYIYICILFIYIYCICIVSIISVCILFKQQTASQPYKHTSMK